MSQQDSGRVVRCHWRYRSHIQWDPRFLGMSIIIGVVIIIIIIFIIIITIIIISDLVIPEVNPSSDMPQCTFYGWSLHYVNHGEY